MINSIVECSSLICKRKNPSTADLILYWFGFDQASKSVDDLDISKTTESQTAKQELGQPYNDTSPFEVSEFVLKYTRGLPSKDIFA